MTFLECSGALIRTLLTDDTVEISIKLGVRIIEGYNDAQVVHDNQAPVLSSIPPRNHAEDVREISQIIHVSKRRLVLTASRSRVPAEYWVLGGRS